MADKPKILVIDDSKETVAGLQSFFNNKYQVMTAENGLDGLKHFEEDDNGIDLVITDLVMPDISGVGVISIPRHPRNSHHRLGRTPGSPGNRSGCRPGAGKAVRACRSR
jgi:response regulator RpfG family c-di-GMP phosphodiesterase